MRTIRRAAFALALSAVVPMTVEAQAGRTFDDAWFWGAKAGVLSFSTTRIENGFAPNVGAEWLITRSRGGLYISLDRAFFSEESNLGGDLGGQVVSVKDLTRLGFSLLAFPKNYNGLRPYFGAGLALSFVQNAEAIGGVGDQSQIDEESSRASFQLLGGVQKQMSSMSLFGQIVMIPFENGFLLNGRAGFSIEAGLRWNMGSAIEKIR
jgi:hypothetical protein